jgi:hypothetical protein
VLRPARIDPGEPLYMKMLRRPMLFVIAVFAVLPALVKAQPVASLEDSPGTIAEATSPPADLPYARPTQKTKLRNYVFDTIGPFPIVAAALVAGVNQAYDTPPEWKQGGGQHYHALRVGTGLQGRHVVLPL